jgi:hypothetical protein
MEISEELKKKVTSDCEILYDEFRKLLVGKNALACLLVTSTLYLSLCKHAQMTKDDVLDKTGEAWDLHTEEEKLHEKVG